MKAPIVEIFQTLQMEGKNSGIPSTFVRFYGCNLRCQFNGVECDTPYAVYTEKDKAKIYSPEQVASKIKGLQPLNIVFTGGEPMLYQIFIEEVIKKLSDKYTFEVETNGTIAVNDYISDNIDTFNISVKLSSSNQKSDVYDERRINHRALITYPHKKSNFKFVINGPNDLNEIKRLREIYDLETYLMPQGITRVDVIKNAINTVKLCELTGYRLSMRNHIVIWDKERGV